MPKLKRSLVCGIAALILTAAATSDLAWAIFVRTAPPPPPRHASLVHMAPHRGMVWTPGYYGWHSGHYSWVRGGWAVPPHRGAVWVAPRWRRGRGGYTFVAGRWR